MGMPVNSVERLTVNRILNIVMILLSPHSCYIVALIER